ncbi:hypothetical protein [Deinococcus humi]|uniref:Uncharacterized protein n=1 Tax=Deinococcus humi TaxID=662880 RepID=A0A7W8JQE2_9DEIO|nr:hypothetical protein [Deinococcus humi]MBB5361302.1 hypothetical protein [Deinococcus humi]GGO19383.1 hypothetical protein GCM10008949_03680 [Deinococcus humi]
MSEIELAFEQAEMLYQIQGLQEAGEAYYHDSVTDGLILALAKLAGVHYENQPEAQPPEIKQGVCDWHGKKYCGPEDGFACEAPKCYVSRPTPTEAPHD